CQHSYGFPLTF
nr:immunoglobulin light chain junction region [Macaca mulatta]MOV92588.1 immunoglobulin light chain junction region [Macaca mulatta]MOV92747.1 immunoglobulin light chain junction region [Macaca mulatta]MOV92903.1 immunoglobulin light chain junction region [Macaca mulatta]MOV92923.1 immunoglobulin light chain junction region [Macaca mulatta]